MPTVLKLRGSWNGVNGSVRGLFYGDPGQLVAQLIGVATLLGFVFTLYVWRELDYGRDHRPARSRLQMNWKGLDIPEMGALCYPEFVLKRENVARCCRLLPDFQARMIDENEVSTCLVHKMKSCYFRELCNIHRPMRCQPLAKQSFHEGLECLQSGEAATAVAALSRCLEQAPDFTPAHIFVGIAHALTSNIYPAIDHLETATQLEPDSFRGSFHPGAAELQASYSEERI